MIATEKLTDLLPCERRILALVAQGKTNPEIAAELGMTLGSARTFVWKIRTKLGALSRYDLMDLSDEDMERLRQDRKDKSKELSAKDLEALRLLAQGKSNGEIARALGSTTNATAKRIDSIKNKLGVYPRVSLALYAVKEGIVSIEEDKEKNQ